ncbi:hypothetical protein FRC03_011761 [Tulasnella sp. 419]|nr:hypothetical protein FRC03_011761 [Tulasnella sp. 419]
MEVNQTTIKGDPATALALPEILLYILQHLSPNDTCLAARDCKFWQILQFLLCGGSPQYTSCSS